MRHDDEPLPQHTAPAGVDKATVDAVGLVTEALEATERARGHLYSFHQLTGSADCKLGVAIDRLREAGHTDIADEIEREILGRNVLPDRWTFQIVEEYDDTYLLVRVPGDGAVGPRAPRPRAAPPPRGEHEGGAAYSRASRPHGASLTLTASPSRPLLCRRAHS
jgi:hypothetical protein